MEGGSDGQEDNDNIIHEMGDWVEPREEKSEENLTDEKSKDNLERTE